MNTQWPAVLFLTAASSLGLAQDDANGLGYRTDGYQLGAGQGRGYYGSEYGHRHFTGPRYSDPGYYRSYHARKDALIEQGFSPEWDTGGAWPPWTPYYPLAPRYFHPESSAEQAATRQLLKTLDGHCYEVQRNAAGEELRTELNAEECAWD